MTQTSDGQPVPQRYWAVATVALGITMSVLDSAIANVALPTIARDLHTNAAFSIWIVNGYQLAITISLLPLASLGDIVGYRRIYLAGLALFTFASLACSLSHTLTLLALSRVLQGFGAAGIMSVNTALIRFIYPRHMLGRGIGTNAVVVAISAAAGPTIASGILSVAPWPWLFAVNVPIGIAAFTIGVRALPKTPCGAHGFDFAGAALSAGTFGFLIGAIDAGGHGEAGIFVALELTLAAVCACLLVRRELSQPSPLFPIDLLRIPLFGLSVATSICSFAAQMLALVALPFHMQQEFGYSAVQTGLLITPWPLGIAFAAPVAGRLADRYPAGLLGGVGLIVFAAGLFALAFLPQRPDFVEVAWRMTVCGLGFGFFQSPNNRAMIASAPRSRSGAASGMLGTARLLGQTIGAALVALLFGRIAAHATGYALFIAAGFAIAAALVSSLRLLQATPSDGRESTRPPEEPVMP